MRSGRACRARSTPRMTGGPGSRRSSAVRRQRGVPVPGWDGETTAALSPPPKQGNERMTWKISLGQVTTAHGVMVLTPTLISLLDGSIGWQTAVPLIIAALIGILWPESGGAKTDTADRNMIQNAKEK